MDEDSLRPFIILNFSSHDLQTQIPLSNIRVITGKRYIALSSAWWTKS